MSVLKYLTKGSRKLVKSLDRWAKRGIKKQSLETTRKSCKLIVKFIRSECNSFGMYSIGATSKSVGYKIVKRKSGTILKGIVGIRKDVASVKKMSRGGVVPAPRKYLHLIVKGVKPHSLGMSRGKVTYPPYVNKIHPGHRGNDFIGRAFRRARAATITMFRNDVSYWKPDIAA